MYLTILGFSFSRLIDVLGYDYPIENLKRADIEKFKSFYKDVDSKSRRYCFKFNPPPNPPNVPFELMIRWQGKKRGKGLLALADPTARTAFGRPTIFATSL